jgi:uncharacterized membrane protein YidH (DUF202 family)
LFTSAARLRTCEHAFALLAARLAKTKKYYVRITSVGLTVLGLITFYTSIPALAATTDITAGLSPVTAEVLAQKIVSIAITGAAVGGAVAAIMLTYLGFKLKTASERDRAETKEHVVWVFIGLALVGCAAIIAGFAATTIKGA